MPVTWLTILCTSEIRSLPTEQVIDEYLEDSLDCIQILLIQFYT